MTRMTGIMTKRPRVKRLKAIIWVMANDPDYVRHVWQFNEWLFD